MEPNGEIGVKPQTPFDALCPKVFLRRDAAWAYSPWARHPIIMRKRACIPQFPITSNFKSQGVAARETSGAASLFPLGNKQRAPPPLA
jgi:hypothetical protein